MKKWKNLTVGKKIATNISISMILLIILTVFTTDKINTINLSAQQTRDESSRFAVLAKDIQIHVIQTQQWLTDISVTKAAEGLDDGFEEAKKHKNALHSKLDEFTILYEHKQDQQMIEFIAKVKNSYDDYYQMGLQMADKYIHEGTAAGNIFMARFDPYAQELTEEVDLLASSQVDTLMTSMENISTNTQHLFSMFLLSVIALLLCNLVAGFFISRSITHPLEKLVIFSKEISSGNLRQKTDISSQDEIGRLAESINTMAANMRDMVSNIREKNDRLVTTSKELAYTSLQMASGSEELSSQSSGVASAANQINANMNVIAETAEKLTARAQETATSAEVMSGNINSVAAAVEEMSASIDEVAENTNQAATLAEEAHKFSKLANSNMDKLNRSATDIDNIVQIIGQITEQTKLLALNATIEAARAGTAGQGFSVVANEVKELAKQTAEATHNIAQQVKDIQNQTKTVEDNLHDMEAINQQVNEVTATISAAVQEQSFTTNDISQAVADTSQRTNSIFDTVRDLSIEIEREILNNVKQASGVINEITENINGVSTVSAHISQGITFASGISTDMKQQANQLLKQVNKFQLS